MASAANALHCTEYRSDNLLFQEQLHISRGRERGNGNGGHQSLSGGIKTFAMATPGGVEQGLLEYFNPSDYFLFLI